MLAEAEQFTAGYYFAISPLMLFPDTKGDFGIYLKHQNRFILYANPQERITIEHLQRLHDNGVKEIYVLTAQRQAYDQYLDRNLGRMLLDDNLPQPERAKLFYSASISIVGDIFKRRLPPNLVEQAYDKMLKLVNLGLKYLTRADSLKSVASLISHDYQTFNHCVHVFIYTASILQTFGLEEEEVAQCGLGALLHDIGKTVIPKAILNKPGKLTATERQVVETHPVKGVGLLVHAPLSRQVTQAVLFHHERVNGQGYPAGLRGQEIPLAVKAVTVSDVYDALTADRPYARQYSPFEALSIMRDEMNGHFDQEVFKRLVLVLSGAQVV